LPTVIAATTRRLDMTLFDMRANVPASRTLSTIFLLNRRAADQIPAATVLISSILIIELHIFAVQCIVKRIFMQ
jgi:hypothetical protein